MDEDHKDIKRFDGSKTSEVLLTEMLAEAAALETLDAINARPMAANMRASAYAVFASRCYARDQALADMAFGKPLPGTDVIAAVCILIANAYVDLIRSISDDSAAHFTAVAVLDCVIAQIQATTDRVFKEGVDVNANPESVN